MEHNDGGRSVVHLHGSATFMRLPKLAEALEGIPPDRELHVRLGGLAHVDHAALELLVSWERVQRERGTAVVIDLSDVPVTANRAEGGVMAIDELVRRAKDAAGQSTAGLGVAAHPTTGVTIVTCMDARVDPVRLFGLEVVFGLEVGDAHALRNAGGVVTEDVIRSVMLSQRLLGTTEVLLVHHTRCGLQGLTEAATKAEIEAGDPSVFRREFPEPHVGCARAILPAYQPFLGRRRPGVLASCDR